MGKEIYPFFLSALILNSIYRKQIVMENQAIMSIGNLNTWNYTTDQEIKEWV